MRRIHTRIKAQLQERQRRLGKADADTMVSDVRYFIAWLDETPMVASIVKAIEADEPDFDPEAHFVGWNRQFPSWPDTEAARAKLFAHVLRHEATEPNKALNCIRAFSNSTNYNEMVSDFTDKVVAPFVDYVQDQLSEPGDLLYLLARYKRRVEWFEGERLAAEAADNTRKAEEVYDRDLRRFLFEQGIDFPFSQSDSPSGYADVVANLGGADPLVLELKLFDGDRKNLDHIIQGFHQVRAYARDYHQRNGYLVVLNLTDTNLSFPSDTESDWPPTLHVDDRTFYVIEVRGSSQRPVSKSKATTVAIDREQLLRMGTVSS